MRTYPTLSVRLQLFALVLHLRTDVPVSEGRASYRQWSVIVTGRKFVIPGRPCLGFRVQWNETRRLNVQAVVYPLPRLKR